MEFFAGGVVVFSGEVEISSVRLRYFRGIEKFSGRLKFFSFSRGVGIIREGLRFNSIA